MKYLFPLLVLLNSTPASSKFAAFVFQIPCERIELKVLSCESSVISNKMALRENLREREDLVFEVTGSIIKAFPLRRAATKCSPKQKVDLKRYKEDELKEKLFVKGYKCQENKKKISVTRPNFFCDTPGTPTIFGCYINKLETKNKYEYTLLNPEQ